jgi:hypothetical protein
VTIDPMRNVGIGLLMCAELSLSACGGSPAGRPPEPTGGGAGGTGGRESSDGASSSDGARTDGGSESAGAANPNFWLFLLIGQSNMEGAPKPEAQDREQDARIKVLAYDNCAALGRTYNEWYTASPPLHSCSAGVGPGDYFGITLAKAFPNVTIGLIPNAINGVDIDYFRKGVVSARRGEFRIPPDNHWAGAYEWVIERAKLAQRSGVIRGILFHQGESDTGNPQWVGKVKGMVGDLRSDLGLGEIPFLAGELLYTGCCSAHNALVNRLPSEISSTFVISANGLAGTDFAHFDLAGQRELGKRYGDAMVRALTP